MKSKEMKIGIVDTTFSRVNMGAMAIDELAKNYPKVKYARKTVPGIKDLPVACQKLFLDEKCDIVMALGMVGGDPIDAVCGHEASTAIQNVMLKVNKHIVEVFVHTNEARKADGKIDEKDLFSICENRTRKHAHNAVWLILSPEKLIERAGTGRRQGRQDEGGIDK